ncbi:unnamed protein product [Paramecium sonneborni]|uniref:Uncharacterized protein n=1 Tax=Paramecium sonneborni TaxID=65129 RepID=A0A8S1KJ06_9CILI|nr:unnamed protein product [Paramecium sonneborni]
MKRLLFQLLKNGRERPIFFMIYQRQNSLENKNLWKLLFMEEQMIKKNISQELKIQCLQQRIIVNYVIINQKDIYYSRQDLKLDFQRHFDCYSLIC